MPHVDPAHSAGPGTAVAITTQDLEYAYRVLGRWDGSLRDRLQAYIEQLEKNLRPVYVCKYCKIALDGADE